MANKTESITVITAPFILSYPKLSKPEPYMENGKPKGGPMYSFEGISALESLAEWRLSNKEIGTFDTMNVEAALVSLAKEHFGADFNVKAAHDAKELSWPFKSGDKKADEKGEKAEHYRGKKFWRAKAMAEINGNPNSPNLYYAEGDDLVKIIRGTTVGEERIGQCFYGGAICTAELNAVAGETAQGKYVTFYVNAVVFEKDGDRLGSGSSIERLRGVRGGQTDYDPTAGMGNDNLDDEIPF
jgi:hypothetical protein